MLLQKTGENYFYFFWLKNLDTSKAHIYFFYRRLDTLCLFQFTIYIRLYEKKWTYIFGILVVFNAYWCHHYLYAKPFVKASLERKLQRNYSACFDLGAPANCGHLNLHLILALDTCT